MKNYFCILACFGISLSATPVSHATLIATGVSSITPTDASIIGSVDLSDLGAAATVTGPSGFFGNAAQLNDGIITPGTGSLYLSNGFGGNFKLPGTYTFALDVKTHPDGYDISSIDSFAGWTINGPQLGNQKYTLSVSTIAAPSTFNTLGTFEYIPFNNNSSTGGSATRMTVEDDAASLIGTGISRVRIEFLNHRFSGPNIAINGTVYYEVDINGFPTGSTPSVPPAFTITSPTPRHIVQRNRQNTGDILVSGTYRSNPDSIEARVTVLPGEGNSGTATDWQTIVTSPSDGSFTGVLNGVSAGGWYALEVRPVTSGSPGTPTVVEKIGIGDIYVTAGQSNSANHGRPTYVPTDDRVVTRTSFSASTWRHGYDPQPLASGTGGSVWSRLGDALVAVENVPIGFVAVGVGSTQVSQWTPRSPHYINRLKPVLQSLNANGFRACLWHQGESDALANVSAATHAGRLNSMISQSRTDAGWVIPWYVAEAAFHPNTNLSQEEPVTSGQRSAVYRDADVFLGPSTDNFHLEDANGGKLADSVHFNAAGLLDHARQWKEILRGTAATSLKNPSFEANRDLSITGLRALVDGRSHVVRTTRTNDSPSILSWRILSAGEATAADGINGCYNPNRTTYTNADDSINGGVMPNMDGTQVAFLSGGSAGNHFLQSTRAFLQPHHKYDLSVSLGVRDNGETFGDARIEILVNGVVLGIAGTFMEADLDSLQGGKAVGKFTLAGVTFTTGETVTPNQLLAVRITKVNGAGTYLDFDKVQLTATDLAPAFTDLGAVWFIGDSITQSNGDGDSNGSPRKSLYDLLVADELNFSYTGHFNANTDGLRTTSRRVEGNLYHYHSGVSGSVIGNSTGYRQGVTQRIPTWWEQGRLAIVKPDVILIMMGANDINANIDVANAPARLSALISTIYALPDVGNPTVFVSNVTPIRTNARATARLAVYNPQVPDIVSTWKTSGKDIYFVDQFTPINDDYANAMRGDNLHPNATGNGHIAQQWYDAIQARFNSTGPTNFGAWQTSLWGSSAATDAGAGEDPDGDGDYNLIEFAFGLDPLSGTVDSQPIHFDGTTLLMTRRIANGAGLTYTLEGSTTLEANSWTPVMGTRVQVISTESEFETVEITKSEGWPNHERYYFLRSKVELN